VHEVKLRKRVVVATDKKKSMGRAGVTLVHTYATMNVEKRMRTRRAQQYQQVLAPQSFFMGAVMQQPQKKWFPVGQT
jgi:hypothetical protein